uniref:Uncharacterized protein MANES_01G190000 n=1 Tax=Rhizophora mucronata TaxID=61149 RepID=A0A2P2MN64_RHIMU
MAYITTIRRKIINTPNGLINCKQHKQTGKYLLKFNFHYFCYLILLFKS